MLVRNVNYGVGKFPSNFFRCAGAGVSTPTAATSRTDGSSRFRLSSPLIVAVLDREGRHFNCGIFQIG